MFSAILFDVDGTLIDTYRLYLESYRRALEPFLGYAPTEAEVIARRPSAEREFLSAWVGADRVEECHARMRRHYRELHGALCEGPYEGVREMLAGLRSADIPLGVVTGKGRDAWEVTEAALDLGPFAVVITEDDVECPKPHPSGLLAAQRQLGVPAADILYVGDSTGDVEAAFAAAMHPGAALWPKTDPGDRAAFITAIDRLGVEHRFERPADLVRQIAPWC